MASGIDSNEAELTEGTADVGTLIAQLRNPAWTISQNAAKLLVQLGEPAVLPLIGELRSSDSEVRRRAAQALGQIGEGAAIEPLIRLLDEDGDKLVLWCAVLALGKLGDSSAVPALRNALQDEDSNVSRAAAGALAQIGKPAVMVLISALSHPEHRVRGNAAWALSVIADDRSTDALITALGDPNEWVRYSAAEALGAIGGERVVYSLIRALGDENADVRATAATALGEISGPEAVPPLEVLVDDNEFTYDDAPVGELASAAIARIRGKGEDTIGV